MAKNYILDQATAARKLERIAYEIWENNVDEKELLLAYVEASGKAIARTLETHLRNICPLQITLLSVQLNKKQPDRVTLGEAVDCRDKVVILVDDVANSGKTLLYSLQPFLASHPKKMQTLVLVERTHKAFPIHNDYVGMSLATTLQDHIFVEAEGDTVTGAYIE